MSRALIPIPMCKTCGKPCPIRWTKKGKPRQFCSKECVPTEARISGALKTNRQTAARFRVKRYRAYLQRIKALPHLTGDDLCAIFAEIDTGGWERGYRACEGKWLKRCERPSGRKVA